MCNTVYSATKRGGSQRPIERNSTPHDQSSPLFSAFFPKLSFLRMPPQHSTRIFIRNVQRKPTYLHLPIEGITRERWGGRVNGVFTFSFFSNGQSLITSMKFRGLYRDNSIFCALIYVATIETHCA